MPREEFVVCVLFTRFANVFSLRRKICMKLRFDRHAAALPLLTFLLVSAPFSVSAQDNGVIPTSKVLVIQREYTKPGKDGAAHQKTEGAFIHALAGAKTAPHYYAATSISGPSRALFLSGYASFAAWEAEHKSIVKDAALDAALDRANAADGDLLSATDLSVWMESDELSLNPGFRVGTRLLEISQFSIRPGHRKEWEELVKLVIGGYKKGVPDAHWGAYEEAYGTPGDRYLIITSLRSGAEIDAEFAEGKQFEAAMGEADMKKMAELESACVESTLTNLFVIDPKMSYPPETFIKAEPDFWKPKAATPAKTTPQ
jgi:hypothetical protein